MEINFASQRAKMVQNSIKSVTDDHKIIRAFAQIPRHLFVPKEYRALAYQDESLPIGFGQTISQPSLVAEMLSLLQLTGTEKVLEVGAGSGYQTALLSQLANKVYTIERIPKLAKRAYQVLSKLHITNVIVIEGDGTLGLENKAPFDAIIVAASSPHIPRPLVDQLQNQGRIVIPITDEDGGEKLKLGVKNGKTLHTLNCGAVRFVPLVTEQ
ncbi:MAG: protein-L-isoaspartate O-methyltransferase [Candidatus Pacebacteria bacterium CG10_big_fil_rev_8_21_14_0_10_44_11]|nr:MAG: protein-L-isoaspartate O-methyltransferase [Candidatus Pacebacteria bacterium CG10_big_fil_rev_8_21_14_0_10_44_11]